MKTMKTMKCLLMLLLVFNLTSAQKKKTVQKSNPIDKNFIGEWQCEDESCYGTLSISKKEIIFSGGPFAEYFKTKINGNIIELYFDYILGTNSFNENTNNGKVKNVKCKKLVAKCSLINNVFLFEGYGDTCGQLPKGKYKFNKIIN